MGIIFLTWLCVSAVCDAVYRKCFNWIVISGAVVAIISAAIVPGKYPNNLFDGLSAAIIFFVLFFVFYKLKMMGAGDVKFAAALGIWVGVKLILPIWALSCAFAVAHGLLAKSNLRYFFSFSMKWKDESQEKGKRFIPYVTYLSVSTVIVLMLSQ